METGAVIPGSPGAGDFQTSGKMLCLFPLPRATSLSLSGIINLYSAGQKPLLGFLSPDFGSAGQQKGVPVALP